MELTNLTGNWTDSQRFEFLKSLDNDEEHEVTDWEAGFLESCIKFNSSRQSPIFSVKQRQVIENLVKKYGPTYQPKSSNAGKLFDSVDRFERTVKNPERKSDQYAPMRLDEVFNDRDDLEGR